MSRYHSRVLLVVLLCYVSSTCVGIHVLRHSTRQHSDSSLHNGPPAKWTQYSASRAKPIAPSWVNTMTQWKGDNDVKTHWTAAMKQHRDVLSTLRTTVTTLVGIIQAVINQQELAKPGMLPTGALGDVWLEWKPEALAKPSTITPQNLASFLQIKIAGNQPLNDLKQAIQQRLTQHQLATTVIMGHDAKLEYNIKNKSKVLVDVLAGAAVFVNERPHEYGSSTMGICMRNLATGNTDYAITTFHGPVDNNWVFLDEEGRLSQTWAALVVASEHFRSDYDIIQFHQYSAQDGSRCRCSGFQQQVITNALEFVIYNLAIDIGRVPNPGYHVWGARTNALMQPARTPEVQYSWHFNIRNDRVVRVMEAIYTGSVTQAGDSGGALWWAQNELLGILQGGRQGYMMFGEPFIARANIRYDVYVPYWTIGNRPVGYSFC